MRQERIDAIFFWVSNHAKTFVISSCVALTLFTGLATYALTSSPEPTVATEQAFISESSRNVGDAPMAVAERRDGSQVFVPGVYVAGDPVTLSLNAEGEVQTQSALEYWVVLGIIAVMTGAFGAVPATFLYYRIDDSERTSRQFRRTWAAV